MVFRLASFIVLVLASVAFAQPPNGGQRGGGGRSTNAVLTAIDANGDHEITMDEMKNAFESLKKLDTDNDGVLGRDEIHPERAGDAPGGPGGGERGGRRGGPDGERGGGDRANIAERLKSFDKNNDGTISKSELPERMTQVVARFDANKDGNLDKEEMEEMTERLSANAPERREGREGREGRGGGGPGNGGGPPSADEVVSDAMEFDANKDGMLSKTELRKFAEAHSSRRGPGAGGPGGERRGGGPGAGGRGGPGGGGDRPERSARPE